MSERGITATYQTRLPRRMAALALALALATSILIGTTEASTSVTQAAPTRPAAILPTALKAVSKPVVVPGKRRVTVTWKRVSGATSYRVLLSTRKSMKKAKKVTTTSTIAKFAKLRLHKVYYVKVIARSPIGKSKSRRVKTKTTAKTTGRGKITSVSPAGQNTIKVSWKRFKQATKVDLLLSWDNTPLVEKQKANYVRFGSYPATATSATVTIPSKYRSMIGSGTGNAAYVRIISYNGPKSRTSPVKFGWPSAPSSAGPRLKVATYNIMSVHARSSSFSWIKKRGAVINTITRANPDVLFVQEGSYGTISSSSSTRQIEDLASRLSSKGWKLAYTMSQIDSAWKAADNKYASLANHILVRSNITVLDAGLVAGSDLKSSDVWKYEDRYYAWAKLRTSAGRTFFAVSVHLPGGSPSVGKDTIRALDSYIARKNTGGYPVIIGGDFNAKFLGPQDVRAPDVLHGLGYIDAASATNRSHAVYPSFNSGLPSRPKHYSYVGTRIDYLMVRNTGGAGPVSYDNQIVRNSDGTFSSTYYGSDHNLQSAVISLGN